MVISAMGIGEREGGPEVPGSAYTCSFSQEVFIEHLLCAWRCVRKDGWSHYPRGAHGFNLYRNKKISSRLGLSTVGRDKPLQCKYWVLPGI